MLLQLAGFLISLCGLLIYLEFGLSLPQYKIRNNIVSIPRSGGEKVYVSTIVIVIEV